MFLFVLDESAREEEVQEFFQELGSGSPATIADETSGGDDEQFEKNIDANVILYKVSDASGGLKVDKIAEKPLSNTALNTNVSLPFSFNLTKIDRHYPFSSILYTKNLRHELGIPVF